ncbi:MAG: hypothetical protein KBG28_29850 [Kofleriaceae bacterium]|nr:hypothetical protein [Kofleriaceae bacterium]MBP9208210.1 hypothetical protein [Kofleriaceae bacterium]
MTRRVRTLASASALAAALISATVPAAAWEPTTTHAGLAEQAGLSSRLHARLVALGFARGLYEPLTVPPADAGALIDSLRRMSPSHGFVPDRRGRQFALAWLSAGAALADAPAAFSFNHDLDPASGAGFVRPALSLPTRLAATAAGRHGLPARGVPAPAWVTDAANPLGLAGFLDQYTKAVRAATPGERSRHMAGALVAAGSMLHVLADLGVPARVRADGAARLADLGDGGRDRGDRLERIAALAFGRVGVPTPHRPVTRTSLRGYFVATAATAGATTAEPGLADVTAARWFSPGTLPRPARVDAQGAVSPTLARPLPALPGRLNLMAASQSDGTTLRDAAKVCLARYRLERGQLSFWLDDDCLLEQLEVILPEVAAFQTGLLDFLFRGELTVSAGGEGARVVAPAGLGAGQVELLAEDGAGVRTSLVIAPVTAAAAGAVVATRAEAAPAGTTRLVALFRGVDAAGEPLVAVGALALGSR